MKRANYRPEMELPADLENAVHESAAYVPALPQDLAAVQARATSIRRRRTALGAVATAIAVLAIGAAVPFLRPSSGEIIVGDPDGRHPIPLWLDREDLPVTEGLPTGTHVPGSSGEIAAQLRTVNGESVITTLPGQVTYAGPAPLPGGWLASIGDEVTVTDANGRVVSSRPMPQTGTYASRPVPMTGSRTDLFWWQWRNTEDPQPVLLTYDLTAGRLRELNPSFVAGRYSLPYFGMQATAERLVEWPAMPGETCTADILDTRSGERVAVLQPQIEDCSDAYFALSPDNRRVALLVTTRDALDWSQRVVVLDAASGDIEEEFETTPMARGADRSKLVYGIDWADDGTIRYARGVPGGPAPVVLTMKLSG